MLIIKYTRKIFLLLIQLAVTAFLVIVLAELTGCVKTKTEPVIDPSTPVNVAKDFDLISLSNNATGAELQPSLSWKSFTYGEGAAATYDLYLDKEADPKTLIAKDLKDPQYTFKTRLDLYTTYYWKVVAKGPAGQHRTSQSTFRFTTRGLNAVLKTSAATFPARSSLHSVVFNGKMWINDGRTVSADFNDFWSSSDGQNWTQVISSHSLLQRNGHTLEVFKDKLWVIGGELEDKTQKIDVVSSTDGINWILVKDQAGFSERWAHASVVYDGKLWVIGGNDGFLKNDVWYSHDGITWTEATAEASFPPRFFHTLEVHDGKLWLIGGQGTEGRLNDVWYTNDGANWTQATAAAGFSPRVGHTSVVYNGKLWVMGGNNFQHQYENDVWCSSDGVNWTEIPISNPFSARLNHTSVVFDNKIWLIAGYDAEHKNDVWYFD